jgi:hypothetical protein
MGNIFSLLLGIESDAAVQVFLSLRRASNQVEAMQTAAQFSLRDPELTALEAMLVVYKSLETQRNDLAHGCYGICLDDPSLLFWIDVKHHVHFQTEALLLEKKGKIPENRHARLTQNLFVYRMSDFQELFRQMEEFWWATHYFSGYLREPSNPRRAAEFRKLCAYPQIQLEIARLNAGRENTPSNSATIAAVSAPR